MKIIVTHDYHFTLEQKLRLDALGDVTHFDTLPTDGEEYLERVAGADVICSCTTGLQDVYDQLKDVYIAVSFVSVAFVDLDVLSVNNVKISNAPGINRHAVAEWILFSSLLVSRDFNYYLNQTENLRKDDIMPNATPGLTESNITILGNGNVSQQAKRLLEATDANVHIFKRGDDLYESVKNADIVIDTLSSNPETEKLLNKEFFNSMKAGSSFLTISRQEVVDEDSLFDALDSGHLAQAFSDCGASLGADTQNKYYKKLLAHPKVNVTPHIAFNSEMSHKLGNDVMIDNMEAWVKGEPQNILN